MFKILSAKKALLILILIPISIGLGAQNVWRVTGPEDATFSGLDAFMKSYMQQYDIRAGSLAVAKDGKILYARGYTWADANYELTMPTSLFRIASCSKPITGMEIQHLIEKNLLTLDAPVVKILMGTNFRGNSPKPVNNATPGFYFNSITVRQLLAHQGGWNRDADPANDPTFLHDQDIANKFTNGILPVSKQQLVSWGISQPQQFYPGTDTHYSNFGYLLLGMVIEKLTGMDYCTSVKTDLFNPLNITRPLHSGTTQSERHLNEVIYHVIPQQDMTCAIRPGTCPAQYGGENNYNFDSFGGWIMAPVDYVKFLSAFRQGVLPMPKITPDNLITWNKSTNLSSKATVYDHGGLLPGSWAYIASRSDGVDFTLAWNTTNDKPSFTYNGKTYGTGNHPTIWHQILDNITTWPNYDLTPAYFDNSFKNLVTSKIMYDGVWTQSAEKHILERGNTPEEFQKLYDKYYKMNYKLIFQESYMADKQLMDGIWVPSSAGQFVTWDKTLEEFQQLYDEWWKKGFRLIHQQAYSKNGQIVYSGIWNPSTNGQFVTWDRTREQFQQLYDEWWKKGFRLIHQQAYLKNGQLLYSGIWNPDNGGQFVTWEKTREQFIQLYNEQFKNGFKLIEMQACIKNGQLLYNGIWNPNNSGQYFLFGQTNELVDAENIVKSAANFQPISLCAHY
jgi:CubicO group peptidase (beta-lactamase class C family)